MIWDAGVQLWLESMREAQKMDYILVWKNFDGYYEEDDFQNQNELVHRLLEITRKEYTKEYGTKIISLTRGKLVDFEYQRGGKYEKLIIAGKVKSKILIENIEMPEPDMSCPVCGSDAGLVDENVSVKTSEEYSSEGRSRMNFYVCSECGREFCT